MKKFIILLILLLPSCSQLSIVTSTVGVAANTSVVAKTYSGVDLITIVTTDKSIKGHIKDNIEENLTPENKERLKTIKQKIENLKQKDQAVLLPPVNHKQPIKKIIKAKKQNDNFEYIVYSSVFKDTQVVKKITELKERNYVIYLP